METIYKAFYSHALRGARLNGMIRVGSMEEISTHTPLAGRDGIPFSGDIDAVGISTHTPLAGRDAMRH